MSGPKRRASGLIGLAGSDFGRITEFSLSLARLLKATRGDWELVGALNYDLAHARNFLADQLLNSKREYLWLIDDDHGTFRDDVLNCLVDHDKDLIGPLCLGRKDPFPVIPHLDGRPLRLTEPPGLRRVDETGGAGLLIHRRVFEAMEGPWFSHGSQPDGSHLADDQFFCRKAVEAGFEVWVDTALTLPHYTTAEIKPVYEEKSGVWVASVVVGGARTRYLLDADDSERWIP